MEKQPDLRQFMLKAMKSQGTSCASPRDIEVHSPNVSIDLMPLEYQLAKFIEDLQKDDMFGDLNDLGALSVMLVETKKHVTYPTIYLLIKLVLILSVATASVERVFSGMTYVKNRLQNNMGDQLLSDWLVTFIEKNVFLQISDDDIMDRFQKMKTRL
ncbi:hypothetical protein ACS0TY_014481 [Phlomoides rotata]